MEIALVRVEEAEEEGRPTMQPYFAHLDRVTPTNESCCTRI